MELGDLEILNMAESLFDDAGIPFATLPDEVIEVQATGSGADGDHNAAVYEPTHASQQGQGHGLDATAYQQLSFSVDAASSLGPNSSNAPGTLHYIDPSGGHLVEAVAGNSVGAAVRSSEHFKDGESGAPFIRAPKKRPAHNQKERMRRARLKTAWASLRQIVPGLTGRTDNASVCERAAEYTRHMNKALVATFGQEVADSIGRAFHQKFQPY